MTATLTSTSNRNVLMTGTTGSELLGEIITWETDGPPLRWADLQDALSLADLDPKLAKRLPARSAFIRAARELSEQRIIRKVDESEDAIRFQFTAESKDEALSCLRYDMETILSLQKESGDIECSNPDILSRARAAFDEHRDRRTGSDVAGIIFKLFNDRRKADLDLIPLRSMGGVYFVREERRDFVDQVERFMVALHRTVNRFPIAKGTETGERSVKEAVAAKMASLVREFHAEVEAFGAETSERSLATAAERVRLLKFKIESYAVYLQDEQERLTDAVDTASRRLRERVAEIARGKDEPALAEAPDATQDVTLASEMEEPASEPDVAPEPEYQPLFAHWPEAENA